jgi:hypothetical protein
VPASVVAAAQTSLWQTYPVKSVRIVTMTASNVNPPQELLRSSGEN